MSNWPRLRLDSCYCHQPRCRQPATVSGRRGAVCRLITEPALPTPPQLVLGDRPIEITLQRAWDALTWRQRCQLAAELADGLISVQQVSWQVVEPSQGAAACAA